MLASEIGCSLNLMVKSGHVPSPSVTLAMDANLGMPADKLKSLLFVVGRRRTRRSESLFDQYYTPTHGALGTIPDNNFPELLSDE